MNADKMFVTPANKKKRPLAALTLFFFVTLLWIAGILAIAQPTRLHGMNPAALNAPQVQVSIPASRDNGLYEPFNGSDEMSNALGQHVPVGLINAGKLRRALYAFDLTGHIPDNAIIVSAALQLSTIRVPHTQTVTISLHKVTSDWGESTSKASGAEGQGAPAGADDATWSYRFYSNTLWTTAGGDFVSTISAQSLVTDVGTYTWSSPQMVVDVQKWLAEPATNFGWIVRGEETIPQHTKRFETRESVLADKRPLLTITYQLIDQTGTATSTSTVAAADTATPTATITPIQPTITQTATLSPTSTNTNTNTGGTNTSVPPTATATSATSVPATATQTVTPQPTQSATLSLFLPLIER